MNTDTVLETVPRVRRVEFCTYLPEFLRGLRDADSSVPAAKLLAQPVDFWRAAHGMRTHPVITQVAVACMSIPLSSVSAERVFSMLSNREIDSRLHAGTRYVEQSLMLAANRDLYEKLSLERFAAKFPRVMPTTLAGAPPSSSA